MDVPAGYAVGMFIMNKKTWNSLPKETQAVLDDLFRYLEVHWAETYDLLENRFKKDIIKRYGVIVADLSPGEIERMKAATPRVKGDWIADMKKKGLPGQENYDALITSVRNFGIILDQTWVKNRALAK
jgi:TRAP-type C4-dicarboxylate transport system substrate-binding protein